MREVERKIEDVYAGAEEGAQVGFEDWELFLEGELCNIHYGVHMTKLTHYLHLICITSTPPYFGKWVADPLHSLWPLPGFRAPVLAMWLGLQMRVSQSQFELACPLSQLKVFRLLRVSAGWWGWTETISERPITYVVLSHPIDISSLSPLLPWIIWLA